MLREAENETAALASPPRNVRQARAVEEGLPYQTLIASVLRKYARGRLRER